MEKKISVLPLGELIAQYPICQDFLNSYRLADLDRTKPLPASIAESKPESMEELGLSALDIVDLLVELITQSDGAAMKSTSEERTKAENRKTLSFLFKSEKSSV